jgi:arylsulfatase A-like enzyme/HEAT repeat protein
MLASSGFWNGGRLHCLTMQLERRRMLRRAFSGGVALGALSMIPLCVIELAYVLLVHRPLFDSYGEAIRFFLYLAVLLVCAGAVLGAVEGLVSLGVSALTKVLAKRRIKEPRWMAWLYSLLALPGIAVMSAMAFGGRRAQQIPGKHLIAFGVGLCALAATYGLLRLAIGVRDRFRIRRWGPRQAALLVPAVLLVAVGFYVADQRVLVRLYGFFHVGLAVATVAFCQLAAGAVYCAFRPTSRWMGRLAEPSMALLIFVGGIAGTVWSLYVIGRWETLRSAYYQHTVVQSKVLGLASRMRMVPASGLELQAPAPTPPALPKSALRRGPRRPDANLVLISIDALRADHRGTYGYSRPTTPSLDRWAKDAVVFEWGYCQVPHTSFSVTSLMTGTYAYSASRVSRGKRHRTIAEALRRYGYKTAGFFPPSVFYIDREQFTAYERSSFGFEYVKYEYLDAAGRIDQVLDFLRQYRSERFFVWIHFFEPHEPYERHAGHDFGPRAVDRYDGEIAHVDREVGRLLDHLRKERPNTIIAVTADHGEEFGEHGGHYHGNALYDQQVHVPVIISVPGVKPRRVDGPAQIIDLPVTLLSLVDVPVAAGMRGTDLGPWLAGESPALLPPAFTEMEQQKLVLRGHHKLICDTAKGFCELYDLAQDPAERRNLIASKPSVAAELRGELSRWMASHVSREEAAKSDVTRLLERGRQRDTGAIDGLLGLMEGPQEVRREVVRLLTLMRAPKAKAALVRAASDADPGVQIQATVGAALLGHVASLGRLQPILGRTDLPPELRRDALLALARAGNRQATRPLCSYLSASSEIYERLEIIEALGELGDAAAGPALMGQLKTLRTRLAAIDALGRVKERRAVPELVRGLREDRFVSWRRAAARALGRIGDPRGTGPLQEAVRRDLEAGVVEDALAALELLRGLPVPGIPQLPLAQWSCPPDGKRCTLALGERCTDKEPRDLLLLFSSPAPPATSPVAVLCGDTRVSATASSGQPASVVNLPAGLAGPLRLEGDRGARLRYAALRRLPRRPVHQAAAAE